MAYEAFDRVNPRLVYVATYGYRASGPNADKPAYDDIIQAGSGIAELQRVVAGSPRYAPTIVADKSSSMAVPHRCRIPRHASWWYAAWA